MELLSLHFDGASKPNPGAAAFGIALFDKQGSVLEKEGKSLGITTNNVAEYCGLIFGLIRALRYTPRKLIICSDSLLLINQIKGTYRVKDPALKILNLIAKELLNQFAAWEFSQLTHLTNDIAHKLANSAIEDGLFTHQQR